MTNPYRGEVEIEINGEPRLMRLTLGALVELEECLGEGSLVDLVGRFEDGRFSSRDVLALIRAGLRGGGCALADDVLLSAQIGSGPVEAARAAAQLLARAFMAPT